MKKLLLVVVCLVLVGGIASSIFFYFKKPLPLISPKPGPAKELPLQKYRIETLHQNTYTGSTLTLTKLVKVEPLFSSFLFSYQTTGKKMTGLINIPRQEASNSDKALPALIMVRGYIPPDTYSPGAGTKNAAEFFATHGYVTVAPDFLSFGGSDPESTDQWEARFQKPIQVVELIKTVQQQASLTIPAELITTHPELNSNLKIDTTHIGMWAHSNGGQIALTSLEILSQPIPTTLWAPVTAPFPYSVLYFSDEEADEGKQTRKWINEFDQNYDALDFSLSQHLELLTGPLQLHQGVADEAIHYVWSDEFVDKIKAENTRRKTATASAGLNDPTAPIEITYFKYPNSNHNMQPDWNTVIQRDLTFFDKELKQN